MKVAPDDNQFTRQRRTTRSRSCPSTWSRPWVSVRTVPPCAPLATCREFFAGFLPAPVKQGYAYSTCERLDVRLLDRSIAIASGVVVCHRQDYSEFQCQAVAYGLWCTGQGWKIFLSATHSPDTALYLR